MGKGSSKGHTPREAKDNLKSTQLLSVIDVISEGPIEGPVDGLKSVLLNSTPVLDSEGNTNISGVTVVFRAGEQEQTPPEGFESSGSETVLGTEVKYDTPINSTSESLAATPKAVKAAYDLANGKYTAQDATTAQKGIIQLSSATNSTSETLAATPKAVKAANDNAEKRLQKDQNGADIPGKDTFTKNIGACRAFGGSVSTTTGNWTTAQFIEWLDSQGAFNHPYWMCKGSWSYGNNKIITDTDCGNIHLAGAVIEVMGIPSAWRT